MELAQRWMAMDANVRQQIKQAGLQTLGTTERIVADAAAQVVAEIARIELPANTWPDLIQILLNNMNSDAFKHATLQTLGYICEEINPEVLKAHSDQILTAICKGIRETNNDTKVAGCIALYNALEFARPNMEREAERNFLMQVMCDGAANAEVGVRQASLECLVRVAELYYDRLVAYMQKLFNITLETIKKDAEGPALQAIEFWATVADEEQALLADAQEAAELSLPPPARLCQNFIRGALKYLVPILLETLTKQEDEPEEDAWNPAMAAGTCLAAVAQTVGDEVVPHVIPFVVGNINSEANWKLREASTLAFGAILEGPEASLSGLITQAMPVLLAHMKDPNEYVKDTTAWTIGRVCQLHPETVLTPATIQTMIETLGNGMLDTPRVAANSCWALHNIFEAYQDENDNPTSPLSRFFPVLLDALIKVSDRSDADEQNLRVSAYEATSSLLQSAAQDCLPLALQALPAFIDRFENTFKMNVLSNDDRYEQAEMQSLVCGVLQVITQRLGAQVKPAADRLMQNYLQVFSQKTASVQEEALMAIGALANSVEADFEKYMPHLRPFLTQSLKAYEEYEVCKVAVGVVGDICRALGPKVLPYCDEIVSLLLQDLQNNKLHRTVKPPILSCFGDIALAIGGEFVKYLQIVMHMLHQASATSIKDNSDADLVDYLNQLREGVFEAYTGIIQGLRSDNQADPGLLPFVQHIVGFVGFVQQDVNRSDAVTRGAIGVLGDLAHALGAKVRQQLQQGFVRQMISDGLKSDQQQTVDVASWAKDIVSKL